MSSKDFKQQTDNLAVAVNARLGTDAHEVCASIYNAAVPLLRWIDYLRESELTGNCNEFLDGLRASIVETAGCASMGLIRPAIFSMRGQVDVGIAWLYFKDHPVEWARVIDRGEGFVLKKETLTFFDEYIPNFKRRMTMLEVKKSRGEKDPYRLLSAHVHSQSPMAVPSYTDLRTMVADRTMCDECTVMQGEVSEYLSDIFLSYYAGKWASLPKEIVDAAKYRLGPDKAAEVFS